MQVETVSAELTITQLRKIALYAKVFQELSESAVYGTAPGELIIERLANRRNSKHENVADRCLPFAADAAAGRVEGYVGRTHVMYRRL